MIDRELLARIQYESIRASYRRLVKPTWEYALAHRTEPWDPKHPWRASLGDIVDQCHRHGERVATEYARLSAESES